jgi:hypothetical protein
MELEVRLANKQALYTQGDFRDLSLLEGFNKAIYFYRGFVIKYNFPRLSGSQKFSNVGLPVLNDRFVAYPQRIHRQPF